MKTKAIAAIMMTMFLVLSMYYFLPVRAPNPVIKIGVMGPMGLIQGDGMKEGAILAKEEIGTIDVGGVPHDIELGFFDEFQGGSEGTGDTGEAAMGQLVTWGADFAIGGFRSESVFGARKIAMDAGMVYLTTGASTDAIIWDPAPGVPDNLATNRDRYKYIFRITPVNSTALVSGVTGIWYKGKAGFAQYVLSRLASIYGSPVKYATVVESAMWTTGFWGILSNVSFHLAKGLPDEYPFNAVGLADMYLGSPNSPTIEDLIDALYALGVSPVPGWPVPAGHAILATDPATGLPAAYHVSPTATDLSAEMAGIERSEARLIIHILSAEAAGRAFTTAMRDIGPKAVAVGINVIEHMSEAWDETLGAVQYQTFLHTTGTRTPITGVSTAFWDAYLTRWGRAPIYTAYGAYAAINILAQAIERAGTIDPNAGPGHTVDGVFEGELIKELEATGQPDGLVTATGRFKFTGPGGVNHDVYSESFGPTWTDGWIRTLMVQWQAGRHEVVWPTDRAYSKLWALPDETGMMYPYPSDVLQEGTIDVFDALTIRASFGSAPAGITEPADPTWQFVADVDPNNLIDVFDALGVRADFGKSVALPLAYDDEAGHLG